jgi:hypothetical protein
VSPLYRSGGEHFSKCERGRRVSVAPCLRHRPPPEALPAPCAAAYGLGRRRFTEASSVGLAGGEAVACLAERALAEGEHLGWLHLEDQCLAVFVFEASLSDLIAPAPVPLPSPSARKSSELRLIGHPDRGAFDDDVGSVFPLVAPGRQDDVRVVCRG